MQQSKYWVKVVCGYRKDQEFSINANEAHKAYYLFNNPDKRGTFSNGVAIKGSDIQRIVPDYNATMGWHPSHDIDDQDWLELRVKGMPEKFTEILSLANQVAKAENPELLSVPLVELKAAATNPQIENHV